MNITQARACLLFALVVGAVGGLYLFEQRPPMSSAEEPPEPLACNFGRPIGRPPPEVEQIMSSTLPERGNLEAINRLRQQGISITETELQETLELAESEKRGEYVLMLERPLSRRGDESVRQRLLSQIREKESPEYSRLFASLGLGPEISDRITQHASKIAQASLEAEAAIHQLLRAREDYDQAVRRALSADNYARYREWETRRTAEREAERFDQFYRRQTQETVDPQHKDTIVNLIQAADGCGDSVTYHRPYDGLPGIKVGLEAGLQELGQRTTRLTSGLQKLLEGAEETDLPEAYQKLLADYYQDRIREATRRMEELQHQSGSQPVGPRNDVWR